jgi:hypothetical protein
MKNEEMISKIKELIFFEDEKWMFPQCNLKEYLERTLEEEIPDYFFDIADSVVVELNKKNVSLDDWEDECNKILEDIFYEPTKEEILNDLKEAVDEVNLHLEGRIKLKSARDLLDEL